MSKFILRLVVVIVLIAGITAAVYFILNKPDKNQEMYDEYISLTKTERYENFEYLTKTFSDPNTSFDTCLINQNTNLKNHYRLAVAIKEQIEADLLLIHFADTLDKTTQESISKNLKRFNSKAYGKNGVAYQAEYLYNYYTSGTYDANSIQTLYANLLVALHEMEQAGAKVLSDLHRYVVTNVYDGAKSEDIKAVVYNSRALIAAVASNYTDTTEGVDDLYKHFNKYEKYLTKFETLLAQGEASTFSSLSSATLNDYIIAYNALDRELLIGLLEATNKSEYINAQQDAAVKANLTKVSAYWEATL